MSARGSTAAFDGVESAVIDELRLEEMRLRQTESQLLSTLGPRHPRVVTLRSELEKRRQQMLEEAKRLHANLRNEQNIAQQRLNSIRDSVAGLQVDSDSLNAAQNKPSSLQRTADTTRAASEALPEPQQLREG